MNRLRTHGRTGFQRKSKGGTKLHGFSDFAETTGNIDIQIVIPHIKAGKEEDGARPSGHEQEHRSRRWPPQKEMKPIVFQEGINPERAIQIVLNVNFIGGLMKGTIAQDQAW